MNDRRITTVEDMIKALKKLPKNLAVLIPGYEGGLCDAIPAQLTRVNLNENTAGYYGPHEEPGPYSDIKGQTEAVKIDGYGNHLA